MSRHHDAHVHGKRAVPTHALDLAFFQNAQQLCLHRQRHIADFVEKERAAMSLFEFADMPSRRSGKRTLFMAEKLGSPSAQMEWPRNSRK